MAKPKTNQVMGISMWSSGPFWALRLLPKLVKMLAKVRPRVRHWKASASSPPTTSTVAPGQSDQALMLRKPPTFRVHRLLGVLGIEARAGHEPEGRHDLAGLVLRQTELGFPMDGVRHSSTSVSTNRLGQQCKWLTTPCSESRAVVTSRTISTDRPRPTVHSH